MKILKKLIKGKKGQTALEYALVIAVVASVVVGAAIMIFGDEEAGLKKAVFGEAVNQVSTTLQKTNDVID